MTTRDCEHGRLARKCEICELIRAEAALACISDALVDSGVVVPDEAHYGDAIRALTAERDTLAALVREAPVLPNFMWLEEAAPWREP